MSAFNEHLMSELRMIEPIRFWTTTEVVLPSTPPKGIVYSSTLMDCYWNSSISSYTDLDGEWIRINVSPKLIKVCENEWYDATLYVNELIIYAVYSNTFEWLLKLINILHNYVPKVYFTVWKNTFNRLYCPTPPPYLAESLSKGYLDGSSNTTPHILRRAMDWLYRNRLLNAFVISRPYGGYHGHDRTINHCCRENRCLWCWTRDNGIPDGIYITDTLGASDDYYSRNDKLIECVIYKITPKVIEWFVRLKECYDNHTIHFTSVDHTRRWVPGYLHDRSAYLTVERLDLLINLMKTESNLLDKLYGIPRLTKTLECIVDKPPIVTVDIAIQTEQSKGLLSRIFGL